MRTSRQVISTAIALMMVVGGAGALTPPASAAQSGAITGYTDPTISFAYGITNGPDGALWFTNNGNNSIGRISTAGVVTNYTDPTIRDPHGITNGPDGALWFTNHSTIGRITTAGVITSYGVVDAGYGALTGITAGPDGALWFTSDSEFSTVWRITTAGVVTSYTDSSIKGPAGITNGPDGALWFTNVSGGSIGRITTAGVVTSYTDSSINGAYGITNGPDGALWFTNSNSIGRITTTGIVTNYAVPTAGHGITNGPDGALWFTNSNSIGRITTTGVVTSYTDPSINGPAGIVTGSDGALWFTNGNSIGRITPGVITTLSYTGPFLVQIGSPFAPSAGLTTPDPACEASQPVAFTLNKNPTSGIPALYALTSGTTGSTGQVIGSAVSTVGWVAGTYTIGVSFAGSGSCPAATGTFTDLGVKAPVPQIVPFPVEAFRGLRFGGTIAFFSYPLQGTMRLAASSFTASIDWGDGSVSGAGVTSVSSAIDQQMGSAAGYEVHGSHVYTSTNVSQLTIAVQVKAGASASVTTPASVDLSYPSAFFVPNPNNPSQNGIGLFIPQQARSYQQPISEYLWNFLDGNSVLDNAKTHPVYDSILSRLAADPGNTLLRQLAIKIGILPTDANGGIGGIGGLSADQVRQVVNVWQTYWPQHIVPHLFDFSGQVGVQLILTAGNHTTQYAQNLQISRDCRPWGGPLSGLFGGFTTCDTYNGIATQFEPKRDADYYILDISTELGPINKSLNLGGGISLIVTKGILTDPANSVFIASHLNAGVGTSLGKTLQAGLGWVGPPDINQAPPDPTVVNSFVNGVGIDGGGQLGVGIGGLNLGLGFNAVYSQETQLAGEEYYFPLGGSGPNATISASVGMTCATPISGIASPVIMLLQNEYATLSKPGAKPNPTVLGAAIQNIVRALIGTGVNVERAMIQSLTNCGPFAS